MTICWELETRFQVEGNTPFDYIEEQIVKQLGAELWFSGWCVDHYKRFLESPQTGEWYRLRSHNGIQPYSQRKILLSAPENPYGIELAVETPLPKDGNYSPNQGNCLEVMGYRKTYQMTLGSNVLHIPFDRMTKPEGNFVEVGIEGTEMPLRYARQRQLTNELSRFIGGRFLPLFDGIAKLHCRPVYPRILIDSIRV